MKHRVNAFIEQEGQTILGWRTVPVDVKKIGKVGKETCPTIRQVFIGASKDIQDDLAFERKLYIIRKQAEHWANEREFVFILPVFQVERSYTKDY